VSNVSILGAGAFGTALALHTASLGHRVRVWAFDEGLPEAVASQGENAAYLPGVPVPDEIQFGNDMAEALGGAELVLFVVPSAYMRRVSTAAAEWIPDGALITSTAKGIESETLALMSDVMAETLSAHRQRLTFLSGPSFARDVAAGLPADVALAAQNIDVARRVQVILHAPRFRVYTSDDVVGVELGGALKNVIAVACGAATGLGPLMTRGLAEIARLGAALGANPLTFLGLAGVGDLTLTCHGELSRNRQMGIRLAKGERAAEIAASQKAVAEGYVSAFPVHRLAAREGVEMPIAEGVYRVCYEDADVREEALRLMSREMKDELGGIFGPR
jgi:glycerol-3-phosphate dehydrogenase (NAD(P)+)